MSCAVSRRGILEVRACVQALDDRHVEAGRRTEIEALNGALIREAKALGIPTPNNEALVALLKGRELHQQRRIHQPDLDYDVWEARIAAGEE